MKGRRFGCILAIEAAICMIFCFLQLHYVGVFSTIAAFPLEQIGWGLRKLSLSGVSGNVIAIIIYIFISMIPCIIYYFLKKEEKEYRIDCFLIGFSILLFVVNYYMINPGLIQTKVSGGGKWMLGCVFYSVLCGYLVLRILWMYASADMKGLQKGLNWLLYFLNFIFVYAVCGQSFGQLLASLQKIQDTNGAFDIGTELFFQMPELMLTYLFLLLHYFVDVLPYLLDIVVTLYAFRVLDALTENRYSDCSVKAVKKLADVCVKALMITVVANMFFNILQMVFYKQLYQIDVAIVFPVFSIVFVLIILLLARYVHENQKLKEDNDLFI